MWHALDPLLRTRFERGGIRVVPGIGGHGARADRGSTSTRDEFFATTDRTVVEARCAAEGMLAEWTANDALRVVITQPVHRDHPRTGERVWYNQFAAHHLVSSAWEYPRIFALRPTLHHFVYWQVVRATVALKRRLPREWLAYFSACADGTDVPDDDMRALLATIAEHTVITPWRRGNVLVIDNRCGCFTAGCPSRGPRRIVACLA